MPKGSQFRPIKRPMLPDMVIEQLREQIMSSRLRPGDRIPSEIDLAEQLGVGRSSVREAIKTLTLMGVLTRTNAGTHVSHELPPLHLEYLSYRLMFHDHTLEQMYEARAILESELAALAAVNATEEDLTALEETLVQAEVVRSDPAALFQADVEFHLSLAQAAGNSVLYSMYSVVYEIMSKASEQISNMYDDAEFVARGLVNHRKIVDAIRAKDPESARRVAREAMKASARQLLSGHREPK